MTGEKGEGIIEEEGTVVDGVFLEETKIPYLVKKIRRLIRNLKFQCQNCTPAGAVNFCLHENGDTCSGVHPPSYAVATGVLSRG
jgi:hypothetical protein